MVKQQPLTAYIYSYCLPPSLLSAGSAAACIENCSVDTERKKSERIARVSINQVR